MIKAIDTKYNGYLFRSRLEARWAVFFDELGIKYEYEKEGYDLDGLWYLPDFWLPAINKFVEVKPLSAYDELLFKKIYYVSEQDTGNNICHELYIFDFFGKLQNGWYFHRDTNIVTHKNILLGINKSDIVCAYFNIKTDDSIELYEKFNKTINYLNYANEAKKDIIFFYDWSNTCYIVKDILNALEIKYIMSDFVYKKENVASNGHYFTERFNDKLPYMNTDWEKCIKLKKDISIVYGDPFECKTIQFNKMSPWSEDDLDLMLCEYGETVDDKDIKQAAQKARSYRF